MATVKAGFANGLVFTPPWYAAVDATSSYGSDITPASVSGGTGCRRNLYGFWRNNQRCGLFRRPGIGSRGLLMPELLRPIQLLSVGVNQRGVF